MSWIDDEIDGVEHEEEFLDEPIDFETEVTGNIEITVDVTFDCPVCKAAVKWNVTQDYDYDDGYGPNTETCEKDAFKQLARKNDAQYMKCNNCKSMFDVDEQEIKLKLDGRKVKRDVTKGHPKLFF